MSIFNIIALFGRLSLFLYGMRLMGDGLKHTSSGTLKQAMEKVTNNPVLGFLVGTAVAFAKAELEIVCSAVSEAVSYVCQAVTGLDMDSARRIEPLEEVVDDLVATLQKKNIQRLHAGICTTYSGLQFMDIHSNLERISDQCSNIGLFTLSLWKPRVMESPHNYPDICTPARIFSLMKPIPLTTQNTSTI